MTRPKKHWLRFSFRLSSWEIKTRRRKDKWLRLYAVARGSTPDTFVIVGVDFEEAQMKWLSVEMSEKEMREHLAQEIGATPLEVDGLIDKAKKSPLERPAA